MVLSIIGWIFAGIGILILVLLLCPVVAGLSWRDGAFTAWVRVLGFIKVPLYPQRQTEAKPPKARKRKKKDEEKREKPRRKRTPRQWLYLIKRILHSAGKAKDIAFKGMRIYDFEFTLAVHEEDASDTAIRYGQVQAAVGAVRALLENLVKIRYKTLVIIPDFAGSHSAEPIFSCKIAACPVIMLVAGIAGFRAFLRFRKIYGREPLSREQKKELEARREQLRAERAAQREAARAGAQGAGEDAAESKTA